MSINLLHFFTAPAAPQRSVTALLLGLFFGSLWKGLLRIALLLGKRPVHTECVSRDRALRHEQAANPSKERGLRASYML